MTEETSAIYRITIVCRKCGGRQGFLFPPTYTHNAIFRKIHMITAADCPYCGEEAYENWILRSVEKMTVKRKDTNKADETDSTH